MINIDREKLVEILEGIDLFESMASEQYVFDDDGIRVRTPLTDDEAERACLTMIEREYIRNHEKRIRLDLPCAAHKVYEWATGLDFADSLPDWLKAESEPKVEAAEAAEAVEADNVPKPKPTTAKEVFECLKLLVSDTKKLETLLFKNAHKTKWLSECKLNDGYDLPKVIKAHSRKGLLKEEHQKRFSEDALVKTLSVNDP